MPRPIDNYSGSRLDDRVFRNWLGNVNVSVASYFEPDSIESLVWVVQQAHRNGHKLRAVGSRWSFEDIAACPDWMVDLCQLNRVITGVVGGSTSSLTKSWKSRTNVPLLNLSDDVTRLVHVEAGMVLFDLNQILFDKGLAMPTLGGSQGQTLAGAISTSTHGGDIQQPPLSDLVRAIHLVTNDGQEMWVESSSDPLTVNSRLLPKLGCPDIRIVRDDELLHALQVSVGRFGVIYSCVLQVRPRLTLLEWAVPSSWSEVSTRLLEGVGTDDFLQPLLDALPAPDNSDNVAESFAGDRPVRYLELLINPRSGDKVWVRRRWETWDEPDTVTSDGGHPIDIDTHTVANFILKSAASTIRLTIPTVASIPIYGIGRSIEMEARAAELDIMALDPHLRSDRAVVAALNALWATDEWGGFGHVVNEIAQNVFDGRPEIAKTAKRGIGWQVMAGTGPGDPNDTKVNSTEIVFDAANRQYIDFISLLLQEGPRHRQAGYISVRYSKKSDALLSMHNVRSDIAVSVEVASLEGFEHNAQWIRWAEKCGIEMGGRPHWGQQNNLIKSEVDSLYGVETANRWRAALTRVVGSSLMFSNDYTRSRGLEPLTITARPSWTEPLDLFWSAEREDNFSTATDAGRRDAATARYSFVRTEGFVFIVRQPGTVPLDLFWSAERGDNFLTATNAGRRDANTAGYQPARTEGFVFSRQQPGTVPLNLYWSEARGDNFITATEVGKRDAETAGYRLVRVEGYVFPRAIALRTHSGQYIGVEGGGGSTVDARRSSIREHETFEVVYLSHTSVALRTYNGYYLCAEGGGGQALVANRTWIGDWEKFDLIRVSGNKIALRVHNGKYVSASDGGGQEVVANGSSANIWEKFELIGV